VPLSVSSTFLCLRNSTDLHSLNDSEMMGSERVRSAARTARRACQTATETAQKAMKTEMRIKVCVITCGLF
jgi:hypothetical protein